MKIYYNDQEVTHVKDEYDVEYVIDSIEFYDNYHNITLHLTCVDNEECTDLIGCYFFDESIKDALDFWGYRIV